jgi:hypothetical protein
MLSKLPVNQIPLQSLAGFISMLHEKGFEFINPSADMFTQDSEDASFAILDPTDFVLKTSPINLRGRRTSVIKLIQNLGLEKQDSDFFYSSYAEVAGLGLSEIISG